MRTEYLEKAITLLSTVNPDAEETRKTFSLAINTFCIDERKFVEALVEAKPKVRTAFNKIALYWIYRND